jgi:hypothetical protein
MMLRQYNKVMEYLAAAEHDFTESLVSARDDVEVRKLQGAVSTLRLLRDFITTEQR